MNSKAKGDIGEQLAAEYLQSQGYSILERNARYFGCEVDIICDVMTDEFGNVAGNKRRLNFTFVGRRKRVENIKNPYTGSKNRIIVFCEVKTRNSDEFGSGAEAVTGYKVGRYVQAAKGYLQKNGLTDVDVRFDIIEVSEGGINHLIGAFDLGDAGYGF